MDYRTATSRDLADVFQHIDQRMTDEYTAAGFTLRQVKDVFRSGVAARRGHTLTAANNRLAVIIWQLNEDVIETGFAAKPEFFDKKYVRLCRKHIRLIQANVGNLPLRSTSYANHPHLSRWFNVLGFKTGATVGGATIYHLEPLAPDIPTSTLS